MSRDPSAELYEKFAEIAQREYEDSLTPHGRVADPAYLGMRIAAGLVGLFDEVWRAEFTEDGEPVPSGGAFSRLFARTAREPRTQETASPAPSASSPALPGDQDTPPARRASPFVSLSPAMRWGAPTINHTRLPVSAIAGMLWAEKSVAAVCDDYEITRADVLVACWYLGMYGSHENRQWRRRWHGWAQAVDGDL